MSGVVLIDPDKYWEYEEFEPNDLQDQFGNRHDIDGIPYIEKWRRGEVKWNPPGTRMYLDHGFFVFDGRKSGVPVGAGKGMSMAKAWYYGSGFTNHKVPHAYQAGRVMDDAFGQLTEKYGDFPYHIADSMDPWEMHQEMYEMLDAWTRSCWLHRW